MLGVRTAPSAACALGLIALLAGAAVVATPVRANDFTQFQNAQAAYDSQNYELAAVLFNGLLSTAPANDARPLALESRKYLAASYLFLGRKEAGEAQFELLLRAVPDYALDPLAFPDEVQVTFARVRARLLDEADELARTRKDEAASKSAAAETRRRATQARLDRLLALAKTERVEHRRSRVIAMLPFGVGQFQNDDDGLGLVLAVAEGTLLAAGVTTFFLHDALPERPEIGMQEEAREAEQAYRISNNISMALLGVIAIAGVIDAQVRFKPTSSEDRPRRIPPDLEDVQVGIGPGSMQVTGRF